jgi:hypothetical protein
MKTFICFSLAFVFAASVAVFSTTSSPRASLLMDKTPALRPGTPR